MYNLPCPYCGRMISKYGISSHVHNEHGLEYHFRSTKTKKESPISGLCFSERKKNLVIMKNDFDRIVSLNKDGKTLHELSKMYVVGYDSIQNLFRKKGIPIVKNNIKIIKDTYRADYEKLRDSELGKKIVAEYQSFGGTIKGLGRKYKFLPKTLATFLRFVGVPIKSNAQARREQAKLSCGISHYRYGKESPLGSGKCHWFLYDGIKYQGSWEFKFGLWLKSQNIPFMCHDGVRMFSYQINGQDKTYCPDFYVDSWKKYVEVKGFFSESDQEKMRIVRDLYPDVTFEVYDKEKLEKCGVFDIDQKMEIEIERYIIDYKTGMPYFDQILNSVNPDELIDGWLLRRVTWGKKAKELSVPVIVLARVMHTLVPKYGSTDFYWFLINRYLNVGDIKKKLLEGYSKKSLAESCNQNLFSHKMRFKLISMIATHNIKGVNCESRNSVTY